MEERKSSFNVDGTVDWYSHYGNSMKFQKMELLYYPAIPLLGIYLEKTLI